MLADDSWSWRNQKLNVQDILRDGQTNSGVINRRIAVWPITKDRTVCLSNLTDGCGSVIYPLELPNDFIRVAVSSDKRSNYRCKFEFKKEGVTRYIQTYWDSTKWVFYEDGEPMPFENKEYYRRRIKRQRLTYEIINEYLEANGWFLNENNFWHSDKATYFIEKHKNKRDE